jgi:hypothetical protein
VRGHSATAQTSAFHRTTGGLGSFTLIRSRALSGGSTTHSGR